MLANGKWLTALWMALALGACSSNGDGGPAQGDAVVIAQVNGRAITLAEIDEQIAGELYEARSEALQARITEVIIELEAEQRGVSPDDLIELEAAELGAVSDEEVEAFFQQNRARMRPNETLESVGPEIRRFLEGGREQDAIDGLREGATVRILLEPPRLEVAAVGPARGPADAPVTIVEFSDYECPFCSRAEPVVAEILERYPEQVRLV